MMSIQSMLEYLFFWVKLIEDGIRIRMMAGCKDYYLVFLTNFSKEGESIWANVDSNLDGDIINLYLYFEIGFNLQIFNAMNESFIQV